MRVRCAEGDASVDRALASVGSPFAQNFLAIYSLLEHPSGELSEYSVQRV